MQHELRLYGDPVLRRKAQSVENFDAWLEEFIGILTEMMKTEDGVGLAAPQIGESVKIAVVDATGGEQEPYVLINPEIIFSSQERLDYDEGCLSIPGITLKVNRPSEVSVRALDKNGKEYVIENASGLLARALQHEIDHLNGILFVDHVSPVQRTLVNGKLKKISRMRREKSESD